MKMDNNVFNNKKNSECLINLISFYKTAHLEKINKGNFFQNNFIWTIDIDKTMFYIKIY